MAIIGIATTIAVPSFTTFLANKRIEDQALNFYTMLRKTRSNAIMTNTSSFICRSTQLTVDNPSDIRCRTAANAARDLALLNNTPNWNSILLSYSAPAGTAIPTPNARYNNHKLQNLATNNAQRLEMLQDVREQGNANIDITSSSSLFNVLGFNNQGELINPAPIRFAVCDDRGEDYGRLIEIGASGQTRLTSTIPTLVDGNRDCTPTNL